MKIVLSVLIFFDSVLLALGGMFLGVYLFQTHNIFVSILTGLVVCNVGLLGMSYGLALRDKA